MHPSFLTTDSKKLIKSEIFDGIRRSYSGRLLSELLMFFAIFLYVYFADIDLLNIQCIDIMIEVINFMDWFYQNRKKWWIRGNKAGILGPRHWFISIGFIM